MQGGFSKPRSGIRIDRRTHFGKFEWTLHEYSSVIIAPNTHCWNGQWWHRVSKINAVPQVYAVPFIESDQDRDRLLMEGLNRPVGNSMCAVISHEGISLMINATVRDGIIFNRVDATHAMKAILSLEDVLQVHSK
jgi:hypothetical protein